MRKGCGDCEDAVFNHVEQHWYCRITRAILCSGAKWPNNVSAKSNLDELECYLEYEDEE